MDSKWLESVFEELKKESEISYSTTASATETAAGKTEKKYQPAACLVPEGCDTKIGIVKKTTPVGSKPGRRPAADTLSLRTASGPSGSGSELKGIVRVKPASAGPSFRSPPAATPPPIPFPALSAGAGEYAVLVEGVIKLQHRMSQGFDQLFRRFDVIDQQIDDSEHQFDATGLDLKSINQMLTSVEKSSESKRKH